MIDTIKAHNALCINARIVLGKARAARGKTFATYKTSADVFESLRDAYIKVLEARAKFLYDSTKDKS